MEKLIMPKEVEKALLKEGRKMGLSGEALNRYVYGTLRGIGWKPKGEKKRKKGGK